MSDAIWKQIQGQWNQFAGEARKRWGKLTDDEIDEVKGEEQRLIGKIQEKYGIARAEAEEQVNEWLEDMRNKQAN